MVDSWSSMTSILYNLKSKIRALSYMIDWYIFGTKTTVRMDENDPIDATLYFGFFLLYELRLHTKLFYRKTVHLMLSRQPVRKLRLLLLQWVAFFRVHSFLNSATVSTYQEFKSYISLEAKAHWEIYLFENYNYWKMWAYGMFLLSKTTF